MNNPNGSGYYPPQYPHNNVPPDAQYQQQYGAVSQQYAPTPPHQMPQPTQPMLNEKFKPYEKMVLKRVLMKFIGLVLSLVMFFIPIVSLTNEIGGITTKISISVFDLAVGNTECNVYLNGEKTDLTMDFVKASTLADDGTAKFSDNASFFVNCARMIILLAWGLFLITVIGTLVIARIKRNRFAGFFAPYRVADCFWCIDMVFLVAIGMLAKRFLEFDAEMYSWGGTVIGGIFAAAIIIIEIVTAFVSEDISDIEEVAQESPDFKPRPIIRRFLFGELE